MKVVFGRSQLKVPLKAKWEKITDADLQEIEGNLALVTSVLEQRYGTTQNGEVTTYSQVGNLENSTSLLPLF